MESIGNRLLLYIGILVTFISGQMFLTHDLFTFMLIFMLLIGVCSMLLRPVIGFGVLVAYMFLLGFLTVATSWSEELDVAMQTQSLLNQIILLIGAIVAWVTGYTIYRNREEMIALKAEIKRLQKIEETTGILTYNEFLERAEILTTGMKRRKETGYLIKIDVIKDKPNYQLRVLSEKLSKVVVKAIRSNFDIATRTTRFRIVIFLNNTDENGATVFIERFYKSVRNEKNLVMEDITLDKVLIDDDWERTLSLLQEWSKEG